MSDTEFRLPDLGEGLRDAEIVQWHVAPGDHVVADQPLVSVETDKAVVEIPAPHSGHIATLGAAQGERIAVGAEFLTQGVGFGQANAGVLPPRRGAAEGGLHIAAEEQRQGERAAGGGEGQHEGAARAPRPMRS